jgi:hypothetical protein
MALPILNDVPKYELKVPSTGKKLKYRPYLVKEEKILLLANESGDPTEMMTAITNTIVACTDGKAQINKLTTFDLEYLFIKIRAKSVGEKVTLQMPCSECKQKNETTIDLDKIECPVHDVEKIIEISETISVEMQWPGFQEDQSEETDDQAEIAFNIMSSCISAVISNGERIDISDEPKESIYAFLESMTSTQFVLLSDFVRSMPQIEHTIVFDCSACGEHNVILVKGIQNFF